MVKKKCNNGGCSCGTIQATTNNAIIDVTTACNGQSCCGTQNSSEYSIMLEPVEDKEMVDEELARERMVSDANDRSGDEEQEEFYDDVNKLNLKFMYDQMATNEWEGSRIHRGDDRASFRLTAGQEIRERRDERERKNADAEQARRQGEELFAARERERAEMFSQRMAHKEELFALRLAQLSNQAQIQNRDHVARQEVAHKDGLMNSAHRDLTMAQELRDSGRDSGESVFAPKQSS